MGRIFIGGKPAGPAQDKRTRIYFITGLLGYLYLDLQQFKVAIEVQHARSSVPQGLQHLICKYCAAILDFADRYPTKSGRMSKKGRGLVKQLSKEMLSFDRDYSRFLSQTQISQKKHQIICDLNWAVSWFITQHDMTDSALKVSTPIPLVLTKATIDDFIKKEKIALRATNTNKKILAHRPKNWEFVEVFIDITKQYKKINGSSKFVPYKKFCQLLGTHNKYSGANQKLSVSVKGYYHLKKAWDEGSLQKFK